MIRLNPAARENFREALVEAVKAQVVLFDRLNDCEAISDRLTGLDTCVDEIASWFDKPEDVKVDDETLQYTLQKVRREK